MRNFNCYSKEIVDKVKIVTIQKVVQHN